MKLAVISDIHSNLQALNRVMGEVEREDPDYILCLGDIVGYGANPNEVVERLERVDNLMAVKGNHDQAVITGDSSGMNPQASRAVDWTRGKISGGNLSFLEGLKEFRTLELDGIKFFLVHGSPRDHLDEYVYEETSADVFEEFFDETGAHFLLMGHTHIPYVKEVGVKTVLNPGSVGQPRDRDGRAALALIDTDKRRIEPRRVTYDVSEAADAIRRSRLPDGLGERLYYGR